LDNYQGRDTARP